MRNDEFLEDDIDDEKTVEYIKSRLPQELKECYSDDDLYYFIDTLCDYYVESGCLDAEADAQGYISLDLDKIARYLADEARKDGIGNFDADNLYYVVEAEMEYSGVIDTDREG